MSEHLSQIGPRTPPSPLGTPTTISVVGDGYALAELLNQGICNGGTVPPPEMPVHSRHPYGRLIELMTVRQNPFEPAQRAQAHRRVGADPSHRCV